MFININKYIIILLQAQVEVDGSFITSQGPGTSFSFALRLVELLVGKEKAEEISSAMLL